MNPNNGPSLETMLLLIGLAAGLALCVIGGLALLINNTGGTTRKDRKQLAIAAGVAGAVLIGDLAWAGINTAEHNRRYAPEAVLSRVQETSQLELAKWSAQELDDSDAALKQRQDGLLLSCPKESLTGRAQCQQEQRDITAARNKLSTVVGARG